MSAALDNRLMELRDRLALEERGSPDAAYKRGFNNGLRLGEMSNHIANLRVAAESSSPGLVKDAYQRLLRYAEEDLAKEIGRLA